MTPSPTPEIPDEPQIVTGKMKGGLRYYPVQGEAGWGTNGSKLAPAGIPYKLLYTEDGGATSQVILEGKTSEPFGEFDSEFPISKALLENPNGQFFISAEAEIDGQKFVTQDRRTDGRRAIPTVEVYEKGAGVGHAIDIALVPPTGQTWDFELTGSVPHSAEAADYYSENGPYEYHRIVDSYTAFTFQLVYYPTPELKDGVPTGTRIVLGETTGNEDGKFVLPVSMDTLDVVSGENFRIEVFGSYHGQYHHSSKDDSLKTLSDLKTFDASWWTHLRFDRP